MKSSFIRSLIRHEELGSTNDGARVLAEQGTAELPLVVRADRQTRGRGRGAHTWWSDGGSLTFSILLDPAAHGLRPEHEPRLALASAVAVVETVARLYPDAAPLEIRWPNDVEADGRKLAGILPERVETARGPRLIVGIGINISTRLADAPDDVRRGAVALADLAGRPLNDDDREAFFAAFLDRLARVLVELARDDPDLPERWRRLDALRGGPVRVDLGPRIVAGVGRGIDAEGALLVGSETGTTRLFGGQVLRSFPES